MTGDCDVEPGATTSRAQALDVRTLLGDVRAVTVDGPVPAPRLGGDACATGADAIVAAGSDRGNELLAHVAAIARPAVRGERHRRSHGDVVTRQRWGGSLSEEARLHGSPQLLIVAPHTQPTAELGDARPSTPPTTAPRGSSSVSGAAGRRLAPRREGRRQRRPRRRLRGGLRDHRGARRPPRRRGRLLPRPRPPPAGGRTPTRSARPARRSPRTSTSRAGSAVQRSTSPARRARRRSSRSTAIRRRRSSRAPTMPYPGELHEIVPAISAALLEGARLIGAIALAVLVVVCGGFFARRAWGLPARGSSLQGKSERSAGRCAAACAETRSRSCSGSGSCCSGSCRGSCTRSSSGASSSCSRRSCSLPSPRSSAGQAVMSTTPGVVPRAEATSSACLVLAGVATAFVIRKVVRPARFKGSHTGEADVILLR